MQTPEFYAAVPGLTLRDPLAAFLGACEEGVIEYAYLDAVKLAGHSCPTVAAAYQLTRLALATLYGAALPERGGIRVEFRDAATAGVTGVMANVVSLLTGAAVDTGFKGLAGRYDRRNLLAFACPLPLEIRYTRLDTGAAVDAAAHLKSVPGNPETPGMLQRCLTQQASEEETRRFGRDWQDRVRRILLEHGEDPAVFEIRRAER